MQSVMSHNFSQVPKAQIPRSSFNRSHGHKTTFDAGQLVPIFIDEALPGDTLNLQMTNFTRLATPIVPIMDNLFLDTFYFAVPMRLVWDNWEKFNGAQTDPGDSTDFLIPQTTSPIAGYAENSIYDYMGIPTKVGLSFTHSALVCRAYNLIWNEWFRDQNLQDSVDVPKGDGPDVYSMYNLLPRGKRHDYFTSCLPWPQKGPSVALPLGTSAPVTGIGKLNTTYAAGPGNVYVTDGVAPFPWNSYAIIDNTAANDRVAIQQDPDNTGYPNVRANLAEATGATINALRQAFQMQKLYERDARGGTRYTEIIKSHFGVTSPDARLQRPEYLGGSSNPFNISPIAQTSSTDATTPQGNLAAMGTASSSGSGFTKSFTEHCIIIGLANIRADLNYQNGLNRMWSRRTRWDFYWPALSHIGEQAVLNQEIYVATTGNLEVFGYQERYAEYRYKPSIVTGRFRSNATQSLDTWHLAQEFATRPLLNDEFIEDNPPIDRVIAVPSEPHVLADFYFNYVCTRPMPTYSVPGLIDHF